MTADARSSALDIAAAVRSGSASAVEITRQALDLITAKDKDIGAFTDTTAKRALEEAESVDRTRREGAAIPVREPGKMPYGVQVIAPPWREDLCLRVAATLEAAGLSP